MQKIRSWQMPVWSVPLLLLGAAVLTYGIAIPRLRLYGDDWIYLWNYHLFGPLSFGEFLKADRPYSAWIYTLTTWLFGERTVLYHILLLVLRWVSAYLVLWLLQMFWPEDKVATIGVALLVLVYPGFKQQPLPLEFILHFSVLALFLLSLGTMVLSLRKPRRFWPLLFVSLVAEASFFSIEYFMGLELIRPLLIWVTLRQISINKGSGNPGAREAGNSLLKQVFFKWLPYLAVVVFFVIWRVFIYKFQFYQPLLLQEIASNPVNGLLELVKAVLISMKTTAFDAWLSVFNLPVNSRWVYLGVLVGLSLILWLFFSRLASKSSGLFGEKRAGPFLLVGLACLLLAGLPIWVPKIPVEINFPWDRSTLPFMIGSAMLLVGLLGILLQPHYQMLALAALICLAAGLQYQNETYYINEGQTLQSYFWQLIWRAPALIPKVIVISDKIPLDRFSDNDLTPILNWIYAPNLTSKEIPYQFFDMEARDKGGLPDFRTGLPVEHGLRSMTFHGTTSDVLVIYYAPPACLQVVTPADATRPDLPDNLQKVAHLSNLDKIYSKASPDYQVPAIMFPEPAHAWCYYYEKADLAAQQGDWEQVVALADETQAKGLQASDTREWLPFISSYAHLKKWDKARQISEVVKSDASLLPVLCSTWRQISHQMGSAQDSINQISIIQKSLDCTQ
jgi:hypothetical protein